MSAIKMDIDRSDLNDDKCICAYCGAMRALYIRLTEAREQVEAAYEDKNRMGAAPRMYTLRHYVRDAMEVAAIVAEAGECAKGRK